MSPTAAPYLARFRKVLDHVDAHLDDELSVERLSAVAAFSKHHFHRQFSFLFGVGVSRYVQLVRLKRASYRLAFRDDARIIDVAFASGYESHEAFTRAFKRAVGQTPSEFRDHPNWEHWSSVFRHLAELRSEHMKPDHVAPDVRIVAFPETRVAAIEHRGDAARIAETVRTFIAFRKQHQLHPRTSATFNLLYDDPQHTPPDAFRMDVCATTDGPIGENPFGVVAKTIPAGRCAVLRHVGSDDALGTTLRYLYSTWLPTSGEELRDFPLYVQRVRFFPDVPEHEAITDVFLPLR